MLLPIERIVPAVQGAWTRGKNLVVAAEPGAGKTTRLPVVMLDADASLAGEIWVAQPRRLAARAAAMHVARSLGEPVGQRVGYQVRFESAVSAATRLRFVTLGILSRKLMEDPLLTGVSALVFDEFHERQVDADLALALARALQRGARPDLRIVVMSATLEPGPVAEYLATDLLQCHGRSFPVAVEFTAAQSDKPLAGQVAATVRALGKQGIDGSILVFLPGAREIRETKDACLGIGQSLGLDIALLHGDLPSDQQDQVIRPGPRPKLILSTNLAETSITIEGVTTVIDSGLARRAGHDPWSGLPTLDLVKVSKASAEQRAGRAGRTQPGRCIRLYPKHDYDRRAEHEIPELLRADLAGAGLSIRAAGYRQFAEVPWLDAPPEAACRSADELLRRLAALTHEGGLTPLGRAMLAHPVHPRLARLLEEGRARKIPRLAANVAALLSERPIRPTFFGAGPRRTTSAGADVLQDLDDLKAVAQDSSRAQALGLDAGACRSVLRVAKQLRGRADPPDNSTTADDEICMALLTAFPDRVASVRGSPGTPRKLAYAGGGQAELSQWSVVHDVDFIVALQADQRKDTGRARIVVRSAVPIEATWLLEVDPERLEERRVCVFDPARERVETQVQTRWDGLLLDATVDARPSEDSSLALFEAARDVGASAYCSDPGALAQLLARSTFAAQHDTRLRALSAEDVDDELRQICADARSFAELRASAIIDRLLARLGELRQAMDRVAPSHITLVGGRRLPIHYEPDRGPWISSRIQDFFGIEQTLAVAHGRVPLALHLLAPNRREVQVTTDLPGFWDRHYPELRRALMRRYPRHAWPEDPRVPGEAPRRK